MTEADDSYLTENKPPWLAFPEILANELVAYLTQGLTEAYFDQIWRPFWARLTAEQRERYLQHWNAGAEWREAMTLFEPDPTFDLEADVRESEEYLARMREQQQAESARSSHRQWWKRIFRRE
jgi:hypothetical protein